MTVSSLLGNKENAKATLEYVIATERFKEEGSGEGNRR